MGEVEAGRKENEGEENIKSMHSLFWNNHEGKQREKILPHRFTFTIV